MVKSVHAISRSRDPKRSIRKTPIQPHRRLKSIVSEKDGECGMSSSFGTTFGATLPVSPLLTSSVTPTLSSSAPPSFEGYTSTPDCGASRRRPQHCEGTPPLMASPDHRVGHRQGMDPFMLPPSNEQSPNSRTTGRATGRYNSTSTRT
ncbi:hypothetical protein TrRE_jg16, partial [Triparma retinervis]